MSDKATFSYRMPREPSGAPRDTNALENEICRSYNGDYMGFVTHQMGVNWRCHHYVMSQDYIELHFVAD